MKERGGRVNLRRKSKPTEREGRGKKRKRCLRFKQRQMLHVTAEQRNPIKSNSCARIQSADGGAVKHTVRRLPPPRNSPLPLRQRETSPHVHPHLFIDLIQVSMQNPRVTPQVALLPPEVFSVTPPPPPGGSSRSSLPSGCCHLSVFTLRRGLHARRYQPAASARRRATAQW